MTPAPGSTRPATETAEQPGLPRHRDRITLRRERWTLPEQLPFGDAVVKPLRGGETLAWRLA